MRIKTSIKRRLHGLKKVKWEVRNYDGANFILNPINYVDRRICFDGGYEKKQRDIFLSLVKETGCRSFIDVGANFGLYSCIVAHKFDDMDICAFECDRRNYAHLLGNLRINEILDRVSTHFVAAGSFNGHVKFAEAGPKNTGSSRVVQNGEGFVTVEQVRLDDYLNEIRLPCAVKIDVEGGEVGVLEGMDKLLKN
ncbi:MAG: FkbM family methyltransferase, partial [Gammaproteobacteria bacterium]